MPYVVAHNFFRTFSESIILDFLIRTMILKIDHLIKSWILLIQAIGFGG